MAVVTAGTGVAPGFGVENYPPSMNGLIAIAGGTATQFRGVAGTSLSFTFSGAGFGGYGATFLPTTGTITSVTFILGEARVAEWTGFNISVADFLTALASGNSLTLGNLFFGGDDTVNGSAFDDYLDGFGGADLLEGGDGNDILDGGTGADIANGGAGNDTIYVDSGEWAAGDQAHGGTGTDSLEVWSLQPGLIDLTIGTLSGFETLKLSTFLNAPGEAHVRLTQTQLLGGAFGVQPLIDAGNASNPVWLEVVTVGKSINLSTLQFSGWANGSDMLVVRPGAGVASDYVIVGSEALDIIDWSYETAGINRSLPNYQATINIVGFGSLQSIEGAIGTQFGDTLRAGNLGAYLDGGAGNDFLYGSDTDDVLKGGEGADYINGGLGYDLVSYAGSSTAVWLNFGVVGGNGWAAANDTLIGIEGAEGTDFDDVLYASVSGSLFYGGAGNDIFGGFDGRDSFYGGRGNDALDGGAGFDTLYGESGNDTITAGEGDDYLDGGSGNDLLYGGTGQDQFYDFGGINTFDGGDGDDRLYLTYAASGGTVRLDTGAITGFGMEGSTVVSMEQVTGSEFGDTLWGSAGSDNLNGWAGNDLVVGADGDDSLSGDRGNDILIGGFGRDSLVGGTGDDTLFGEWGDDNLQGGDGDDVLHGQDGNDRLDGQLGNDWVLGWDGDDTLNAGTGNDIVIGGFGNDLLRGEDGDDLLFGEIGNDQIFGGTGNDTLFGQDGEDQMVGQAGADRLHGLSGNDKLDGGTGDDWLFGGDGDDQLYAGQGSDILEGGAGDDLLSNQFSLIYDPYGASDPDNPNPGPSTDVYFGEGGNDRFVLDFYQSGLQVRAYGGEGDDVFSILGNLGSGSVLDGGAGNDKLNVSANFGGAIVDLRSNVTGIEALDIVAADGNNSWTTLLITYDQLLALGQSLNITSRYTAFAGNLAIQCFGASNVIDLRSMNITGKYNLTLEFLGVTGNITYHMGDVTAPISYATSTSRVVVDLLNASRNVGDAAGDVIDGSKITIIGTAFNDELAGSNVSETLKAGDGQDLLLGRDGDDFLYGEAGADTLIGGLGDDGLYGGLNDDVLFGEAGNDYLNGSDGNNRLYGQDGNDVLTVDGGNNVLEGGAGDDALSGGYGVDFLDGGDGADRAGGGFGNDQIFGRAGNDRLTGGEGSDTLFGGAGNDFIEGSEGQDTIYGEDGDDTIYGGSELFDRDYDLDFIDGGAGNDLIQGGSNADTLIGGLGDDQIGSGFGSDLVIGGAGNDVLGEGLYFNSFNLILGNLEPFLDPIGIDTYFGEDGNDTITSTSGADRLYGQAGDDFLNTSSLQASVLEGGDGADTLTSTSATATRHLMVGGAGADVFKLGGIGVEIFDFSSAQGDKIHVNVANLTGMTSATVLANGVNVFSNSLPSTANASFYLMNAGGVATLFFDQDGSGSALATVIAYLPGTASLAATDLVLW